ncbi:hypothetical protein POM88_008834 [Heracleum sosnowskyi]|uniref:Uncharacterized protein n=1 Tax=Heracleum sosnowskyi TaxID=360622 RepID=A0AAD8N7R4_9APIA|nr:hypothetical protein POM88_008834 [Heracleum sosnowskyi]
MTWLIRDVDHRGGGSFGAETPDYGGNSDLFTIKLHIGVRMCELFYKLPKSAMDFGLFPLNFDSRVIEMCKLVEGSRLMYVYCETSEETQASQFLYTQCEYYVEPTPSIEFERK